MSKYIDNLIVESKLERKIDRFEPSIQNTAASAKVLTLDSESIQIFNGTTAGQILRLPNAT
ncbi:MAG: hypothetical protein HC836_47730, partial [Richelia sp. RM2_1_2]|nr:hypothetical protein [Richelia sp. RM2_1_2]